MAFSSSLSFNSSDHKRALVIGNNEYRNGPKLQCCINDAEDISDILQKIHFDVTIGTDLTTGEVTRKIYRFVHDIQSGDLVVFFFAGHGTQWNDQNFLIPVDDDQIVYPEMVKYRAINVQDTLTMIMNHKQTSLGESSYSPLPSLAAKGINDLSGIVGNNRQILTWASAEIAHESQGQWLGQANGIICFITDCKRQAYYFCLYDFQNGRVGIKFEHTNEAETFCHQFDLEQGKRLS
ncbi:unnamed protein product [Rotaria sordida]|uniref:Caspase family p20 domain-containing protein n=1 Tax=Rotaria sordida TaxID=392033 RepID=A0A814S1U4_9BILA|nr:unnamed protein product [Rotaria sordida]